MNEAACQLASREKLFSECGPNEQIERLRRELCHAILMIGQLTDELAAMRVHEHGSSGLVVVPVKFSALRSGSGGLDPLYLRVE